MTLYPLQAFISGLIIFFNFICANAFAQTHLHERNSPDLSDYTNRLIDRARTLSVQKNDSALFYFKKAEYLAYNYSDNEIRLRLEDEFSIYFIDNFLFDSAGTHLKKAETVCCLTKNQKKLSDIYDNISTTYYYKNNMDSALRYLDKSTAICEILSDTVGIVFNSFNYLSICVQTEDTVLMKQKLAYLSDHYASEINRHVTYKAKQFMFAGAIKSLSRNYKEAIRLMMNAKQTIGKKDTASMDLKILNFHLDENIGSFYALLYEQNNNKAFADSANYYCHAAIRNGLAYSLFQLAQTAYISLATLSFKTGAYQEAINYSLSGINLLDRVSAKRKENELLTLLINAYEKTGKTDSALYYSKQLAQLNETLHKEYIKSIIEKNAADRKMAEELDLARLSELQNEKNIYIKNLYIIILVIVLALVASLYFILLYKKDIHVKKEYSNKLINELEKERSQISRELHDSVGQKLLVLNAKTGGSNRTEIKELIEEVRTISKNLTPLYIEKIECKELLTSLIEDYNSLKTIYITYEFDCSDSHITYETKLHLYRILQECLNNIFKHSNAKNCRVLLSCRNGHVTFEIKDDGIGFNPKEFSVKSGIGIYTINHRAQLLGGKLKTRSSNKGTEITLHF